MTPPTSRSTRCASYSQEDQIANAKRFRAGELDLSAGIPGQLLDELRRSIPDKVRLAPTSPTGT